MKSHTFYYLGRGGGGGDISIKFYCWIYHCKVIVMHKNLGEAVPPQLNLERGSCSSIAYAYICAIFTYFLGNAKAARFDTVC